MIRWAGAWLLSFACGAACLVALAGVTFDEVTREQATLERQALADGSPHRHTDAMAAFARKAKTVEYPSGEYRLPGHLYVPEGAGPFPAVIWNHGSEKNPRAQVELARFYTQQGYVFFAPIRHGHAQAPGPYIVALQDELRLREPSAEVRRKIVGLHELYNKDVAAAVDWLKEQPAVDRRRLVVSGVSYGGIQTVLAAEKGLGARAFVSFAPGAMSFANDQLRDRLSVAARNAKAPLFVLQARNDFSTGPVEMLSPILARKGAPSRAKLYDTFGTTRQQGHGAFACWSLGTMTWGEDVLGFIDAAMKQKPHDSEQ